MVVCTSEGTHWIGNRNFFFKSKSNYPPPTHVVFSQNTSSGNFEIVFLFKIIQRSYDKAVGVDINQQSLGARVVSYAAGAFKIFMEGWLFSFRSGSFD